MVSRGRSRDGGAQKQSTNTGRGRIDQTSSGRGGHAIGRGFTTPQTSSAQREASDQATHPPSIPPTVAPSLSSQRFPPIAPKDGASTSRASSTSLANHRSDSKTIGQSDEMVYVQLKGKGCYPSSKSSRVISDSFQEHQDAYGVNWKSVTVKTKDRYWREFQETSQNRIEESASAHTEGSEQHVVDETQIFLEVATYSNKRHIYGIESQASSYYSGMQRRHWMSATSIFETGESSQTQAKRIASLKKELKE
ncbi:hypothetical protein JCGZ_25679 [Jatropha curcas]|uniref:Uncharacterized protein n=1 Tax=Jatropha curcas TaxID=180498 RepID=A0A067LQG2_JATCU|nr:hypothetical protein JCGZ_25679 [Jatropha curcas]